jgi:DNA-binding SARP family transcriptional activator
LDYGLSFASHEVTKDQRTSLDLTPETPLDIPQDFELTFDLSYQRLTNAFGYIFRIIANDSLNIDLVSSPSHTEFYDLNLIINNAPIEIHYDFDEIGLKPLEWNKISLKLSHKTNQITVSWNGHQKTAGAPLARLSAFRFLFGANDLGKFNTADVPPISLRNIKITTATQSILWKLKKHGVNTVYSEASGHIAITKNPVWLIDQHAKWVHRKEFSTGIYPSAAFDNVSGILYFSDIHTLHILDLKTGKVETIPTAQGTVAHTDANQLLFVPETRELINYDLSSRKYSRYDLKKNSWENTDTTYNEPRHWHNNKFYNPADSSLYTFGGYGFYAYNNAFHRYDKTARQWVEIPVQGSMPPRYLGALGLTPAKDKALIFGGYGSQSGKQEISPQSFYDLYSLDLKTHELRAIWQEKTQSSTNIVFSNSLVVNGEDSCFYVLSYPKDKYKSSLKLRSYSLSKPSWRELGDSIPFLFHDVHSFSDLYLSQATQELVAITVHKEKDQFKVHVYTINYPPLHADDILQSPPSQPAQASLIYYLLLGGLGLTGITVGLVRIRRKRTPVVAAPMMTTPDAPVPAVARPTSTIEQHIDGKTAVIDLFGGFQVIDKHGNDITHKFTSTVKELLIFILLHSVKLEKGVSTAELHEVLWPDKDDVSARNNRNVNLKKLRNLFEEIGDIVIENTNSYVRMTLPDTIFCDYQTAYRILNSGKLDRHKVEILIKYVRRGSLLPNMQTAWLDTFKSEISNRIIDELLAYSSELDLYRDDKMLLDIADSIFNYDTINQEAMVLKCSVLNKKGKHSLAKNWYDHFAKEYMNLYGENYPKTFEEVVS